MSTNLDSINNHFNINVFLSNVFTFDKKKFFTMTFYEKNFKNMKKKILILN